LRFIGFALERPETAGRLDRGRQQRVVRILLGKLRDGRSGPEVRKACVRLGGALETRDQAFCREAAHAALDLMARTTDLDDLLPLVNAVGSLAAQLPPEEAGGMVAAAARKLLDAWT